MHNGLDVSESGVPAGLRADFAVADPGLPSRCNWPIAGPTEHSVVCALEGLGDGATEKAGGARDQHATERLALRGCLHDVQIGARECLADYSAKLDAGRDLEQITASLIGRA